ncbi:MAG: hypothetical protein QXY84_00525 [Candidatus Caldarchaeum sp.]
MMLRPSVALKAFRIAVPAIALKALVIVLGLEFMPLNPLIGSVIAGAIFVMGFVLGGLIADYKEAERMPSEIRAALDRIWTETKLFHLSKRDFDIEHVRRQLLAILRSFLVGVEKTRGYGDLRSCIESIDNLSSLVAEMEKQGAPPFLLGRVKDGRENLLRNVLRIYYIQRTVYLPSARFLAEVLMIGAVGLLLFVQISGVIESLVQFGIITYFIVYLRYLSYALDTPFRQGERTQDDVSLFLLKDYEQKLATDHVVEPLATAQT